MKNKEELLEKVNRLFDRAYDEISAHLDNPEPHIHTLNEYQISLGVIEILYEDAMSQQFFKDIDAMLVDPHRTNNVKSPLTVIEDFILDNTQPMLENEPVLEPKPEKRKPTTFH